MKFLLDANFLLIPGNFKVDVFSELQNFGNPELYTIDLVIKELESLASGRGADARAAKLSLLLIKEKRVQIIETKGKNTDKELEKLAEEGYIVCTQDKELIKRLKTSKLKVIYLRKKKILAEG